MPRSEHLTSNMVPSRFANDRITKGDQEKRSWKFLPNFNSPVPSEFPMKPRLGATPVDFRTPPNVACTPNVGERFHAFVAAESADEDSTTSDRSGFKAGQHFWLKFLERRDSESQTSEEDSRNRKKTPSCREINRTWSTSSSITECSSFHVQGNTPRGSSFGTPHSVVSEDGKTNARRKASVSNKWKSPRDSLPTRQGAVLNTTSNRRFSFTLPPTPSQRATNIVSTPVHRRSTPRAFGGDVTNLSAASLTPKYISSPGNQNYKQSPNQRQPEHDESKTTMMTTPLNRFSGTPGQKSLKPPSKTDNLGEMPVTTNSGPNASKTTTKIVKETASKGTNTSPRDDRETNVDRPSVDSIITLNSKSTPSFLTSLPGVVGRMEILRLSPRADYKERFQWAYEAWQRVGLMQTKAPAKQGVFSPRISSLKVSPQALARISRPLETPANMKHLAETNCDRAPATTVAPVTKSTTPTLAKRDPPLQIKARPSAEPEDHSAFQHLLKQWRDKSDDKPNTHFLSPEQEAKSGDLMGAKVTPGCLRGTYSSEKVPKGFGSPFGDGHITESRAHGFVHSLSEPRNGRAAPFCAGFAGGGSSQSIHRSTTFGDDQPTTDYTRSSTELVDSDKFEGKHAGDLESCRALVVLESKETYEVMVGENRNGGEQRLVLRSVEQRTELTEYSQCQCSQSVFSGDDDLISFFLPQMGMACKCGRSQRGLVNPSEPTAIENVLRPWQVEFLNSFGITRGEQLVKARHRSADVMAQALRQWRKQKNMTHFRTQSCGMAIHIWAKTCKTYVRSIRKQLETGSALVERQPVMVLRELSQFLADLPVAPPKRRAAYRLEFEPESQMEV
jgi:hypothetical protein